MPYAHISDRKQVQRDGINRETHREKRGIRNERETERQRAEIGVRKRGRRKFKRSRKRAQKE